jgi:glycosyltransferase involved in cell wall biosynthesis
MKPRVTTIIAHQNYTDYLASAIQSAKKQTYANRICVVDDGSNDPVLVRQIIDKELFGDDPGETFLVTEKQEVVRNKLHTAIFLEGKNGPSYARNRAIEETLEDTDYFQILDADDEMYPNKIQTLVKALLVSDAIGAAYADYHHHNVETGQTKLELKEPYTHKGLLHHCLIHSGSLIKKEALLDSKEENFYDEQLRCAEDYDLWIRISRTYVFSHVPTPLTKVRVHKQNSTETVSKDIWNQCLTRIREKNAQISQ